MIAQINALIDAKLLLLFEAKEALPLNEFKKSPKSKLQDATILAEMMLNKGLIAEDPNLDFHFKLTELGKKICENGGWLIYLEIQNALEKPIITTTQPEEPSWKKSLKLLLTSFKTNG